MDENCKTILIGNKVDLFKVNKTRYFIHRNDKLNLFKGIN